MKEEIKVSYEQIKKANEEMSKTNIKGTDYATVNERIKAYRKVYPSGQIYTNIEEIKDNYIRIKVEVSDETGKIIATGTASEELTGDAKKDYINKTSMVENCETSAVGRALGFAGFGIDKAIASAEDIEKNKARNKMYEIYKGIFISDDVAKYNVKVACADLMRKMGIVKAELEEVIEEELWTNLEEMTTNQLLKLELRLKTLNSENNPWHSLYNKNIRIKEVAPVNQTVIYESSNFKFGKIALEKAGTDEIKRNEIIDYYLNAGIDLLKGI